MVDLIHSHRWIGCDWTSANFSSGSWRSLSERLTWGAVEMTPLVVKSQARLVDHSCALHYTRSSVCSSGLKLDHATEVKAP